MVYPLMDYDTQWPADDADVAFGANADLRRFDYNKLTITLSGRCDPGESTQIRGDAEGGISDIRGPTNLRRVNTFI